MEESNKNENDKKINETENKKNEDIVKIKIGTVGNFILAAFVILIIGTGALTYYLIHTAKNDYDKQYNKIISNLPINNIVEDNDPGDDTVANMIGSVISDVTNQTSNTSVATDGANSRKILNEELVVLYNGLVLETDTMDEVTLKYIDSLANESDKYVITYYNYENYSFQNSKLGTLSTQVYEGLVKIDNVGKIAISEDYDAIPRDVKVVNTMPTIVTDNNPKVADYDTIKTLITDLDGNGTDEYILILANKTTGFSKITLIDSKGSKIADLASIEKSRWKQETNAEYYLSISNVELIDVDNDGVMEIVLEIPQATGNPTVSLLKYKNGELQGKKDIQCSLIVKE